MTHDLKSIISVSTKPVIELGKLGCFDEHGIFPINVLHHQGKVYAYTCGWSRRVFTSVETGIGFATSNDGGETFTKLGDGPILGASLREPFLVGDAFCSTFSGRPISYVVYVPEHPGKIFEEKVYLNVFTKNRPRYIKRWHCLVQDSGRTTRNSRQAQRRGKHGITNGGIPFGRYHMFLLSGVPVILEQTRNEDIA